MLAAVQSLPSSEQVGSGPAFTDTSFASSRLPASLAAAGRTTSAAVTIAASKAAPNTGRSALRDTFIYLPSGGRLPPITRGATNTPLTGRCQLGTAQVLRLRSAKLALGAGRVGSRQSEGASWHPSRRSLSRGF